MEFCDNLGDFTALPEEILIHIIKFLPNRWNLSQVNCSFYELICKIEENKYRLKLIDVSIKWIYSHQKEVYVNLLFPTFED